MQTNTTDSSVISSYIHRFRYSRPTAPNERNPLSQKEAFWWLKEDESNVDRDDESEQMNSNTKDLSTYSEDSLDQRDISTLPQKIEQPKVSDSIGYSLHNEDLSSQGLSEILHSMETISTEASSEVNLRSQESLPSSSSITSSYSARHSYDPSILETLVKHKGIIPTTQRNDDDSRYVNSDEEQECVDEEEEVEEVLDMDDHMRQIIRQCNRLSKDLRQNTAQLKSESQPQQQQQQLQRKNDEEITIKTKAIPIAYKSNKTTRSNNYNNPQASSPPPPPPPLRPESPRARANYLLQLIAQETANDLPKENNRDDDDSNEDEEDGDEAEGEEVRSSVEAETETESMWARYSQSASSHHHQKRNKEDDNSRKDTRHNKEQEKNEVSSSTTTEGERRVLFTAEDDAVHELLKEFNLFSPPSSPVPVAIDTAPLSPITFSSPIIKKVHPPIVAVAIDRDDKDDDQFSSNNKKDNIESAVATTSIAHSATNLLPLSPLPLEKQLQADTIAAPNEVETKAAQSSSSVIPSSPSLLYFLSSDEEDKDDDEDDDKDSDQDEEQHIQQKRRQRRNEVSEQTPLPVPVPPPVPVDVKINVNVKTEIELDPTEVQAYLHDEIVSQLWSRLLEVRSMIQHHHQSTR